MATITSSYISSSGTSASSNSSGATIGRSVINGASRDLTVESNGGDITITGGRTENQVQESNASSNVGGIIGGIVLVLLFIVAPIVYLILRRRRSSNVPEQTTREGTQ